MAFLTREEIEKIGFKKIGDNISISDKSSIYNPQNISLGSNIRIDDFSILSASEKGIVIGDYVHIACFVSLIGHELIHIKDFVGISARTSIYSSSDDYLGNFLTGPTIPEKFKKVDSRPVIFESHSIVGAGTIVLPGVTIGEGTAVGALSLITKSIGSWGVYTGIPVKFMKPRKKEMLQYLPLLK